MYIKGEIMNVKWVNFSGKLWNLLEDLSTNHFVCWNWVRRQFGITPNWWASFELLFSFYISKWLLFYKEVARFFLYLFLLDVFCDLSINNINRHIRQFKLCFCRIDYSNCQKIRLKEAYIFSVISFIQRYIHLLNGSIYPVRITFINFRLLGEIRSRWR